MLLEFDVSESPPYVQVRVSGAWSDAVSRHMKERAIEECMRRGRVRALIDARELSGLPALHQSYVAAADFAGAAGGALQRVAMVDRDEYRDRYDFYELVAKNRGLTVRFFADLGSAQEWLDEGPGPRAALTCNPPIGAS